MIRSYRDLDVWRLAMELAEAVYRCTAGFPRSELFGLVAQMRRAAISIPSNIAEGRSRSTSKEFHHFLSIALGSLAELETQLELAIRLGYSEAEIRQTIARAEVVGRKLNCLRKSIKSRIPSP